MSESIERNIDKSDDASKKILGFKYQEMVALVKCLEAKDETSLKILQTARQIAFKASYC